LATSFDLGFKLDSVRVLRGTFIVLFRAGRNVRLNEARRVPSLRAFEFCLFKPALTRVPNFAEVGRKRQSGKNKLFPTASTRKQEMQIILQF
jgi:hypothetical protein